MARYRANEGKREYAIRLGCERGIYLFIHDYADEMGMSMSGAVRRLLLIGARCESEHGKKEMPTSYGGLSTGSKALNAELYDAFKRYDDSSEPETDWN